MDIENGSGKKEASDLFRLFAAKLFAKAIMVLPYRLIITQLDRIYEILEEQRRVHTVVSERQFLGQVVEAAPLVLPLQEPLVHNHYAFHIPAITFHLDLPEGVQEGLPHDNVSHQFREERQPKGRVLARRQRIGQLPPDRIQAQPIRF